MEKNDTVKVEKPDWKWYYSIDVFTLTRGKRDYVKDREIYEAQFLKESEKVAKKQLATINGVSALFIMLITTLWTLLPPLIDLPSWLTWLSLGMEGFGGANWGNQLMLTIIPGIGGLFLHNAPKLTRGKLKIVLEVVIKIVPIIILIITTYLIFSLKKYFKYTKLERQQELARVQGVMPINIEVNKVKLKGEKQ